MRGERALEPPRDLTLPLPGSTTVRELLSRSLARLMHELPALLSEAARETGAEGFREWTAGVRKEPAAIASLLRRPHLGGLARVLRGVPDGPHRKELLVELLATLAYELSVSGSSVPPLSLKAHPGRLVALGARQVIADSSPPTMGYVVLEEPILFALADNNPLAMTEAHPDKHGNVLDLGGRSVDDWVASLQGALGLIREFVPELRAEMDLGVQIIVPVGFDAHEHLSASYKEVPGTLYLSLHPDPMTMAEALVHEFSHTKMNLLSEHDGVLENAFEPLFPSPVRPDLRPLWGVLLAVHAFLPVELLYARMQKRSDPRARASRFAARAKEIRKGNEEGLAVLLEHARPTPVGEALLAELGRIDASFRSREG